MNSEAMSRSRSRSYSRKRTPPPPSPPSRLRNRENDSRSVSREGSKAMTKPKTRDRSRHRSRSNSSRRKLSKYSRSRSRSYSPYKKRNERRRSNSRSSYYNDYKRRHVGSRINPEKSRCLGVFGLSVYTTQAQIVEIFSKYGSIERVQVVVDAKTGRSRGFCFIYFDRTEDAKNAKYHCCGMEIDSRRIRVDYSITKRPHTPTPGVYMGQPTRYYRGKGGGDYDRNDRSYRDDDRGNDYYDSKRSSRRSPSPYRSDRRRRYDRSRSRSISPRDRRYR